jgi:hypothetical protein
MTGRGEKKRISRNAGAPTPKRKAVVRPSASAELAYIAQANASSDSLFLADWPLPPPELPLPQCSPAPASIAPLTPINGLAPMLTSANVPPPPLRALPPTKLNAAVRRMFSLDDDSEEVADKAPAGDERDAVAMTAAEPTLAPVTQPTPMPLAEPEPAPVAQPTLAPAAEPEQVPVAEPVPAPAAEPEPVPVAEPEPAPAAEPTPVLDAEPTLATTGAEPVPVCSDAVQAIAPVVPEKPVVRLVDRVRAHPVDCFRCSQTGDGLWHTLPHALDFYRELYAISQWREEAGAEQRWYAALARAGVVRGEECSVLRWPLNSAAHQVWSAKVHPVAHDAVRALCWHVIDPPACDELALQAFIREVIVPSLLCLHEQARQQHETLLRAEEALALEELHARDGGAVDQLRELGAMLARTATPQLVAHLYCSVIGAPSSSMQCAYQKTKRDKPASMVTDGPTAKYVPLTLSPPPLPEEALPLGLRRSIDSERVASKKAGWPAGDCASPRSIEACNYKDLFLRN